MEAERFVVADEHLHRRHTTVLDGGREFGAVVQDPLQHSDHLFAPPAKSHLGEL